MQKDAFMCRRFEAVDWNQSAGSGIDHIQTDMPRRKNINSIHEDTANAIAEYHRIGRNVIEPNMTPDNEKKKSSGTHGFIALFSGGNGTWEKSSAQAKNAAKVANKTAIALLGK
jgi:hypothetical protein